MGADFGYSKAAERRIAIWKAMNPQPAAPANADTPKPTFEALTPSTKAETAVATATPSSSSQLSAATMDTLLAMVSDLSTRLTKQEVGIEYTIDYLQEGRKQNQAIGTDISSINSKIDQIANDISVLNGKFDQLISTTTPSP